LHYRRREPSFNITLRQLPSERRKAQRAPKESSGRTFFPKLSYTVEILCICAASKHAAAASATGK
jgi:hypothetical protein